MTPLRIIDDRKRPLDIFGTPRRIVSLLPSETDNVRALGCLERLVGRTDYCLPVGPEVAHIASVGGTKDFDVEAIVALAPDLILANQEENNRKGIEELCRRGFPVFISFPCTVDAAIAHLARLARMLRVEGVPAVKDLVRRGYATMESVHPASNPVRVFVPIWADPLMTADGRTYLSSVLAAAGAINVFHDRPRLYPLAADLGRAAALPADSVVERDTRYPRITVDEVIALDPELMLFPDEPHPFTEADVEPFRALPVTAARTKQLHMVRGSDLLWQGARTVDGVERVKAYVSHARQARQ